MLAAEAEPRSDGGHGPGASGWPQALCSLRTKRRSVSVSSATNRNRMRPGAVGAGALGVGTSQRSGKAVAKRGLVRDDHDTHDFVLVCRRRRSDRDRDLGTACRTERLTQDYFGHPEARSRLATLRGPGR